jgi:plastocyanin
MTMSKRKGIISTTIAVALVGIVAGLLPGCASTPTPTPTSTQAANEVIIRGRALLPDPITVTAGTTVTWTNEEFDVHTISSDDGLFNADLAPGMSFSYTFNGPGTFIYHAIPLNADEPFDGKVIVQ